MILLTGATGYIGSHTWLALEAAAMPVVGIDDFSNSSPEVLRRLEALGADVSRFARVDVTDRAALEQVFARWPIRRWCTSREEGGRRERRPAPALLRQQRRRHHRPRPGDAGSRLQGDRLQLHRHGLRPAESLPVREDAPLAPSSPYGSTKLMSENILRDVEVADPTWRSPCCATSTRSARIRAARSAKTRAARRTT
jgi:UDP-glucose 4-epimerase